MVEVPGPLVLNEPHAPLLTQATDHLTPALAESLMMATASDAVAFTWRDAGAAEVNETEIGSAGVVFMEEPPQPAIAALILTAASGKMHWRKGIGASFSLLRGRCCLRPE